MNCENCKNKQPKTDQRELWSRTLRYLVVFGFLMSHVVIILVGLGVLDFGDNPSVAPAAGALETYGLAWLVIRYYFNDGNKPK